MSYKCFSHILTGLLPPANEVWGKVIFLHLFVILFTGGVPDTPPGTRYTPKTRYTPPDQVHPQTRYTPPGPGTPPRPGTPPSSRYTPQTRYTPGTRYIPWDQVCPPGPGTPLFGPGTPPGTRYTPLDQVPPQEQTPPTRPGTLPRCRAWSEIRSTRGRYASYWNAILFLNCCWRATGQIGNAQTDFAFPLFGKEGTFLASHNVSTLNDMRNMSRQEGNSSLSGYIKYLNSHRIFG